MHCSPPPSDDYPSWTDESWASPLDVTRRIFCNRSLNMRTITAVGFDMVRRCAEEGGVTRGVLGYGYSHVILKLDP